ncbi:hypothetical protein EG68_00765 [Paragonimus skrjabini miyazakii]|uniref:Tetraspanin n=1 Tax=Paragonimus skrjabini miyazakii TaxID=59628 RepID=A0A8S9ZCH7_9TREM|nr:hypothetical protein EG68_00765 [Paragonimus skrjabini miyazakii]
MCGIPFKIILCIFNGIVMATCLVLMIIGAIISFSTQLIIRPLNTYVAPLMANLPNATQDQFQGGVNLILPMIRPIGIGLMIFAGVIILVSGMGFVGAMCNLKVLKLYILLLLAIVSVHLLLMIFYFARPEMVTKALRNEFYNLVKKYKSFDGDDTPSVFLAIIMIATNCCGANNGSDFRDSMNTTDKLLGKTYTDLQYPIVCCKMDTSFKLLDANCPTNFNTENSNINEGCVPKLEAKLLKMTNIIVYVSLSVILFNTIIIAIAFLALL